MSITYNHRARSLGEWLANVVARRIPEALEHLQREQTLCDGWAARGDSAGRGGSDSSTTEAAAEARYVIRLQVEDIRDALDGVEIAARHLDQQCAIGSSLRAPEPVQVKRCRDNQTGREGAIEWGNPACEEIPVKAGVCSACYQRERRWRVRNGLEPREIEPPMEATG